jgi:hypothetical protein
VFPVPDGPDLDGRLSNVDVPSNGHCLTPDASVSKPCHASACSRNLTECSTCYSPAGRRPPVSMPPTHRVGVRVQSRADPHRRPATAIARRSVADRQPCRPITRGGQRGSGWSVFAAVTREPDNTRTSPATSHKGREFTNSPYARLGVKRKTTTRGVTEAGDRGSRLSMKLSMTASETSLSGSASRSIIFPGTGRFPGSPGRSSRPFP